MSTSTLKKSESKGITVSNNEIGAFLGKVVSFNTSLKLHHWHVTGVGSYATHIALDQAIGDLLDATDRLVETTYAMAGDINIIVPETKNPANVIEHASVFFAEVDKARSFFEEAFTQAIIDDYQEAIQQLLYRLKRLS